MTLSPFEVVAESTGYFQSNTMSGTRLNSKIEDLRQSITVVTKEQMSDFAMLDINDIFDQPQHRGHRHLPPLNSTAPARDGQREPRSEQRQPRPRSRLRQHRLQQYRHHGPRAGGSALDDSLELSRGPNANIFGLGNSSGTVNQVPSTANLRRDFTKVELRGDSYDGWRASLDLNRMLLQNKLALRASYANQHTGFVRKPPAKTPAA